MEESGCVIDVIWQYSSEETEEYYGTLSKRDLFPG
jgi:hypothetical protein